MKLRPPIKIHGGKFYLSSWVIEHLPANYEQMGYIEPFVGGGSVFLNKAPSPTEAINDLDLGVIQIWRALRDEPSVFIQKLKRINYTEPTFKRAKNKLDSNEFDDYMEHAISEFIVRRMSRGGMKDAFAWSERLRGGQPGDVNAWDTIIKQLPELAERAAKVHIFQRPAVEVIKAFDDQDMLCYCDPPYLPDTRSSPSVYGVEMTTEQHIELAETLNAFRGRVALSGYPSALYKSHFANWRCVKKTIANHAGQTETKSRKVECLWMNYDQNGKLL